MDNRQAAVDVLKGLAIVAVVLHHVLNRRFDPEVQANLLGLIHLAAWAVYAFLFGSGYLHALSRRTEAVGAFIWRRAVRLLVPYLWLGVFYAAVFQVIQSLGFVDYDAGRVSPGFLGKVKSLLWCDQEHVIGEQLYFFVLLFGISSLFVLLLEISRSDWFLGGVAGLLLVGMAALIVCRPLPLPATGMSVEVLVGGMFQYVLGFLVGRSRAMAGRWGWCVGAGFGVAVLVALVNRWAGYSWGLLFVPLGLFLLLGRVADGSRWVAFPRLLGQASGAIFAYHTPLILQPLLILQFKLQVPQYVNVVVSVAVTMGLCVLIHKVVHRYEALRWLRV